MGAVKESFQISDIERQLGTLFVGNSFSVTTKSHLGANGVHSVNSANRKISQKARTNAKDRTLRDLLFIALVPKGGLGATHRF